VITIALQAGGQSSRMGQDKALVHLAGIPLIEHQLAVVTELGDEVLITTNEPRNYEYLGVRLISDEQPGLGALNGLLTALQAANGDQVLVLACDLPFIHQALLSHLLSLIGGSDVVIPLRGGEYEPLHAVYSRLCIPHIQRALMGGNKRIVSFFPEVSVREVRDDTLRSFDPEGLSFFNINTPNDLTRAEEILARKKGD
jgi:molybdopterin-guanine dinucleotide biosynthesis protein A